MSKRSFLAASSTAAIVTALAASLLACSGQATGTGAGPGVCTSPEAGVALASDCTKPIGAAGSVLPCVEKAGADTDDECAGTSGKPRKLDCDASQTETAVAAGCTPTKPGGSDVCCPSTIHGTTAAATSDAATSDSTTELSIATVRNPAAAGHVALGASVVVSGGVVTGVKTTGVTHGFFMQDPDASAWAGIFVNAGSGPVGVAKGDVVTVSGQYTSYRGFEEITTGSVPPKTTGSASVPAALVVSVADIAPGGARARELQSMLLRVVDVEATTATTGVDFYVKASGSGAPQLPVTSYVANDVAASPFPATVGQSFLSITGFGYSFGASDATAIPKLAPRSADDVQ